MSLSLLLSTLTGQVKRRLQEVILQRKRREAAASMGNLPTLIPGPPGELSLVHTIAILTSDWSGAGLRALLRDALALAVPAHAPRTRVRHRGDVPLLPRGGDQRQAAVDTLPNVSSIFFSF